MSAHWPEVSNGVTAPCHHTEGLHKKAEKAAALPKQQRMGQAKNGEEKTKSCSTEADERHHMRNLLDYPEEPLFKILYAKKWTFYFSSEEHNALGTHSHSFSATLKARTLSSHSLPQKEGATQRASPELPLRSRGQRLLPCPSFNLESHTHGSPKQMAAYTRPLHHQPEPMTWLQLPKLLQSWLPTWLHLMAAGNKPKIKHCWRAAVTGTFRGWLEGNQSRKKCNSKEKPLGQRNPRDITETYFKVLREDWQKLLAITKKLMDIFKVSSKHILHIKHMFLYVPSSPPQLVFVPLDSFTFTFYFHVTYVHTCSNEGGHRKIPIVCLFLQDTFKVLYADII